MHIIAARDEARPHAGADGRDAHPYLARMVFAGGLGFAVGGLRRRTSRDAGPYLGGPGQHAVLPLPEAECQESKWAARCGSPEARMASRCRARVRGGR
jgi:hypothetical protein